MNCKACRHPDHNQIDLAIVNGRPLRALVATFGISLGALHRHKSHLAQELATAMRSRESESEERGVSLLSRVESLVAEGQDICAKAKADKKYAAASNALNAVGRNLELIGKLTGELQDPRSSGIHLSLRQTTISVTNYDEDVSFAQMIGEATHGFDVNELMRLKRIAEGQKALPACTNPATPSESPMF
jgi:hypothetical protein